MEFILIFLIANEILEVICGVKILEVYNMLLYIKKSLKVT